MKPVIQKILTFIIWILVSTVACAPMLSASELHDASSDLSDEINTSDPQTKEVIERIQKAGLSLHPAHYYHTMQKGENDGQKS